MLYAVQWILKHRLYASAAILVLLLLIKFLYPLFFFDAPLGYDPGMYRYLFIRYSESLREFSLPGLEPWAREYPPGLFALFTPFMLLGLSPDSIIGWIWNLTPVLLLAISALIIAARQGRAIGIVVLLIGLLSVAFYDGFFAMYYKVFVSLIFVVLTFHFAEKMSPWFLLTAFLTLMIHQQSALVLVVSLGIWWIMVMPARLAEPRFKLMTLSLFVVGVIAMLWYLPHWERAIWSPLKSIFLLRGDNAPPGSFPPLRFYLTTQPVLIALGSIGFLRSFRKERGSMWQIAVLVCLLFIAFKLVFYRRFFLHLDFFLMPFAAAALVWLFSLARTHAHKAIIVLLLCTQAYMSVRAMELRKPHFDAQRLAQITSLKNTLPEDAAVIAMENVSGTWLRGWLPHHRIGAPGLFDYPGWTYKQWEEFIDGTQGERKLLLQSLTSPVYFLVTDHFMQFYGERAKKILSDPCLQQIKDTPLLHSLCSQP